MHLQTAFTAAVLLAGQAIGASGYTLPPRGRSSELYANPAAVRRAIQLLADVEEALATDMRIRAESIARRQNMDSNTWDQDTSAACTKALAVLNGTTTNPSGIAVCYNLPFYDNTTGVFQADLRLYQISDPRDQWAGVKSQDINAAMSYVGAAVSPSSRTTRRAAPPNVAVSWRPEKRQGTPAPQMLQVFNFVGQINKDLISSNMTANEAEANLTPSITLSAKNPQGQDIESQLSTDEVHFIHGVFAKPTNSTSSLISATAKAPFVLPGTTLGIFPIGLIITSAWTLLFVTTVGYGTVRRYQFREHYRMRIKRDFRPGKMP
ncbi:MAG: hypothetical protein M1839_009018 [Geoglossum umbratile]|nr:MAG: hypothetical protein M1839_009018 [Geoglossum umbratile]